MNSVCVPVCDITFILPVQGTIFWHGILPQSLTENSAICMCFNIVCAVLGEEIYTFCTA